jgi:transmembrane sensor
MQTDEDELNYTEFADYLSGKLTPEQEAEVARRLDGRPGDRRIAERLQQVWPEVWAYQHPRLDLDAVSRNVAERIAPSVDERGDVRASLNRRNVRGGFVTSPRVRHSLVAFAACLLVLVGWSLYSHRAHPVHARNAAFVYSTAPGQRASIMLPDGTSVLLSVASRIDVPGDYAAGNRTVILRGEAIFDVHHQADIPLIVHAGPAKARVLGTRFVVRHYPGDAKAVVAVEDGKVAVDTVVLSARQEVHVGPGGVSMIVPYRSSQFTMAEGILTIEDMRLKDAIEELGRWYNAEIHLQDERLAALRVGGKFSAGAIADLTEFLEWTLNLRVVRQGRKLTIYPKG